MPARHRPVEGKSGGGEERRRRGLALRGTDRSLSGQHKAWTIVDDPFA